MIFGIVVVWGRLERWCVYPKKVEGQPSFIENSILRRRGVLVVLIKRREETRLEKFEKEAREKFYEYLLAKAEVFTERIIELEHGPSPEYSEPGAPKLKYPTKEERRELIAHSEEVASYLFDKLKNADSKSRDRGDLAAALFGWLDLTEVEPESFTKEDVRKLRDEWISDKP